MNRLFAAARQAELSGLRATRRPQIRHGSSHGHGGVPKEYEQSIQVPEPSSTYKNLGTAMGKSGLHSTRAL
jgi:hypothetical protein